MTLTRASAALLLAGYAGLAVALAAYWRADPSAVDRYLVLAGAAWAAWVRWQEATAGGRPRPLLGLSLVALGAALYPLGWAGYFVLFHARSLPFWLMWIALAAAAGGWVVARFGLRAAWRLAFPLAFVAFALPQPDSVLRPIQGKLQSATTDASEAVLRLVGYPVVRPPLGNVLMLPNGELGVGEACSGVKALTALTATAAFLAFWRRFGVVRGVLLVAAAVPVVVVVNVLRVVLSGVIQEAWGAEYIRDGWHDALGFAVVLVGLAVVLGVGRVIGRGVAGSAGVPPALPARASEAPAVVLLTLSLAATVAVVWHGRPLVPPPVPTPPLDEIATDLDGWTERSRLPVPSRVTELLHPDGILHREYRSPLGQTAVVWVIYWESSHAVHGYHHPDVCLPAVGYQETARGVVTLTPTAGGEVPATARTLAGPNGSELYALYWTQAGRQVWGPADELEAQSGQFLDQTLSRAVARWQSPTPPSPAGRLVVLIGCPNPTPFGKEEVNRFAKSVADDVYRLCPSVAPPVPPE